MTSKNSKDEMAGWLSIVAVMLFFPTFFFLCVYFPIWIGLTPRW